MTSGDTRRQSGPAYHLKIWLSAITFGLAGTFIIDFVSRTVAMVSEEDQALGNAWWLQFLLVTGGVAGSLYLFGKRRRTGGPLRRSLARAGPTLAAAQPGDQRIELLVAVLKTTGEPDLGWLDGEKDALVEAWESCEEIESLVALLGAGADIGVFERDGLQTFSDAEGVVERWLFRLRGPDGRYYRMDFTREDGADGVRRCFPDFPGAGVWHEAYETARAEFGPLERLAADARFGRRHRYREYDPVQIDAAWSICDDFTLMCELVDRLMPSMTQKQMRRQLPVGPPTGCSGPMAVAEPPENRRWRLEACDAIREVVPALPIGKGAQSE